MSARISIIGAGAAGCFCAAELKALAPDADVRIYEAGTKPMAKLALTGGGRCNLSNTFEEVKSLKEVYPRGFNLMKRALKVFGSKDACTWFEARGVQLKTEVQGRIFPVSDDAMEIVYTLRKGLNIECGRRISSLDELDSDFIVVTTGGGRGMEILKGLDLEIVPPVPSLFGFNIKDNITSLQGISASVRLSMAGFRSEGPMLITDWGFSGPAVLKLSSYAARFLAENAYSGSLTVNWMGESEQEVRALLERLQAENSRKLVASVHPLPSRLWEYLLSKAEIPAERRWSELGSKGLNRLVSILVSDTYTIAGKTRFKEEFVTAGGVSLSSVDARTLECKTHPGLYFAGEVLDIDAITGGFNLQAAWTTGYIVAHSIFEKL